MLVCAHMCACICKRFINYVNVLACLSSCIWCRRSRTRSVVQHFIHMAAVLSWASSRVRVLWEDAPVELDHTFTITSFLCHSQYMKILTLEHHARLDIDPYLSGWGKKIRLTLQAFEQTSDLIPWSIFVIPRHSCGALGDEAVCCGLMETGLILRLNDLSWLGADFISQVHFFFFFSPSEAVLVDHTEPTSSICIFISPFTGYGSSSYYCKLKHDKYSEYVQDISLICEMM